MPDLDTCYLRDLRPGQSGLVHSVNDDDPGLLRYLETLGLVPGASFEVIDLSPYDNNLHIRIKGENDIVVLGASVTVQIRVEILDLAVDKER